MISILQQPTEVVRLSGNELLYRVLATDENGDRFRYLGARVELRVPANTTWAAGEQMFLIWQEPNGATGLRLFLVSDDPIPPGSPAVHLPTYTGYANPLAYWEDMALRIGNDPIVRPIFYTYVDVDAVTGAISLWIVARRYEEGWTIQVGPDGTFTYTPFPYSELISNRIPGHRILMDVYIESGYDSMQFDRVATLETVAGSNSEQWFNISEIVHSSIKNRLPDLLIPAWDTANPVIIETVRKYYTRIAETATDIVDPDSYYTSELIALCGGVANSLNIPEYLSTITLETSILSWRSKTQTIGVRQPYFLNFFISNNYVEFPNDPSVPCYLEVEEYNENHGLVTTRFEYNAGFPLYKKNRIITFPVGVDALGIGATTAYYRVRVMLDPELNGTPGSDWRTFEIDRNYYIEERYLAYTNSFFAPEVLRCVGTLTKQMNVEQDVSQHIRVPGVGPSYSEQRNTKVSWSDLFTYNSAFLDGPDCDAVNHELRIAENIYEISPAGYIPLRTTGKGVVISQTRQNLHQLTIAALPTAIERFYSRIDGLLLDPPVEVWGSPDGIGIWASPLAQPWS